MSKNISTEAHHNAKTPVDTKPALDHHGKIKIKESGASCVKWSGERLIIDLYN